MEPSGKDAAAWRCFVGLPLPRAYQDGLERIRARQGYRLASRLSWTRPGNWHLTLKFLGGVDQARLPLVRQALAQVAWTAFEMQAAGAGTFPPLTGPDARPGARPRVLWTGLAKGADHCARLAQAVDAALTPLGFEGEKRPLAAHLTLARVKQPRKDDWQGVLDELAGLPWPAFIVDEMVLWRSVLLPVGPEYTRLEAFRPRPGSGLP